MSAGLSAALLLVSSALLVPVMLALLALLAWSLLQVGVLAGEGWARRARHPAWRRWVAECLAAPPEQVPVVCSTSAIERHWPGWTPVQTERGAASEVNATAAEKLLDDLQLRQERGLGRLHLGLRLGPMFGLAGTLIPLGPALVGLSAGDVGRLAENLVVAFATTVVGLVCGALCLVVHGVRQRWAAQDLSDLNHVLGRWP